MMHRLGAWLLLAGFCAAILVLGWSLLHHRVHKAEVSFLVLAGYLLIAVRRSS